MVIRTLWSIGLDGPATVTELDPFDLGEAQLDRGLPAEDFDEGLDPLRLGIDLGDRRVHRRERTVDHHDRIALGEVGHLDRLLRRGRRARLATGNGLGLGSGDVLHFAMHAYSSPDPMRSGLLVRADAGAPDGTRSAGDESVKDDGVLHAFELLTHPVRSPMVVLSACETGQGAHQDGEGVRSLARAFMLAGAQSTVSSLWKVDDRATKEIMVKFYEHLAEGMGKADALAEAKRWYRRTYPNEPPSKWAAFILIGDNEPVRLKKRSPVKPWMIVLGALVLVGAAWAYRQRTSRKAA